ncbi:hypothetical protein RND81_02G071300 [Saponaria officinalis]|uniref:Uncharacterized protein n=1 Tax=Saponaria officinalis TaxID=3572 RepID=A0AAW1ML68_SAPOF
MAFFCFSSTFLLPFSILFNLNHCFFVFDRLSCFLFLFFFNLNHCFFVFDFPARQNKAVKIFAVPLRPIVHGQTLKYNMKLRDGKWFSLEELAVKFLMEKGSLLKSLPVCFLNGISPVEFGKLPALQDAVIVVGYPIEGDTISVTSGVVSRIEILSYVHGSTELLSLQIDAAINS